MTSLDTAAFPRSFPVSGPLGLSVRLGAGNLVIIATDATEAVVDLSPARRSDPDAMEVIAAARVEFHDGSLRVDVPERRGPGRSPAILVRITVPTGSNVTAEVGAAEVEIQGGIGVLDLQTGSGDIVADACGDTTIRSGSGDVRIRATKSATVKTGSGDVEIEQSDGDLLLKCGSGDIRIGEAAADGRISTGSGDVELGRTRGGVGIKTASGDVLVRRADEGELSVDTASGTVTVGVPEGTVARLDCSSVAGQVHSQLEPGDAPGGDERRLVVTAHTVSGRISINRVR